MPAPARMPHEGQWPGVAYTNLMDALPTLTTEMVIIMVIVVFAVLLFATELLRVDVAAILIMTLRPLPSGGRGRRITPRRAKRDDRRTKCGPQDRAA